MLAAGVAGAIAAFFVVYNVTDGADDPPVTDVDRVEVAVRAGAAVAALAAGTLAWGRLELSRAEHRLASEDRRLADDRDVTERYSRSIDQISDSNELRSIGGVYTLERVALDANRQRTGNDLDWMNALEVLATYARIQSERHSSKLSVESSNGAAITQARLYGVVEAVTVLGRFTSRTNGFQSMSHNLRGVILTGANLAGTDLSRADLSGADLAGANLANANLEEAILDGANLAGANLQGANLTEAKLVDAKLQKVCLEKAVMEYTDFRGAKLVEASFRGATLSGVEFTGADLSSADFKRVDLSEVGLYELTLHKANLSKANMTSINIMYSDLSGAELIEADLTRSDFTDVDLRGANLFAAILTDARWHKVRTDDNTEGLPARFT